MYEYQYGFLSGGPAELVRYLNESLAPKGWMLVAAFRAPVDSMEFILARRLPEKDARSAELVLFEETLQR